jgi:transposase
MRRIKEVLRLKFELGLNDSQIAASARLARSTVQDYMQRVAASGLEPQALCALGDEELDRRLFPPREQRNTARPLPDWEAVERELRRSGVTLLLLWREYVDAHPDGYQYTQFLRHFRAWQRASRPPTMRQVHRAGETLEVDYAGMTLTVMDMGVPRVACVFVACLPCSNLVFAEMTWTQGQEDWLGSHVRALSTIGGCPEKLVPDNLKSGVTDAWYYDPVLNRAYHELAQHYGIAIVPARVRRPRDKSSVESAVKHVERWVLAPLRDRRFLSPAEANTAIAELVEVWNNRPFSPPREGSRRSLFESIERPALKPLPSEPFVIGQWLTARVNVDYHIAVDDHYYSVPYRLLHAKVDVFLTATAVSVFADGVRVASHARSFRHAEHTTLCEHMPPAHQAMARRTPQRLREDAAALGMAVGAYVARLLDAREHPEQGVRACLGVLRLAKTYGQARLELACERALAAGAQSSRTIEQLLKADLRQPFLDAPRDESLGQHANVRGSGYYN